MNLDLDKIERDARAAQERSPGPWRRWRHGCGEVLPSDANTRIDCILDSSPKPDDYDTWNDSEWHGATVLETDSGYYEPKGATATHIANCSPDVVLALIHLARAAAALVDDYRSDTPDGGATTYALCRAVDALRGEP